jgi:hypothetical protein
VINLAIKDRWLTNQKSYAAAPIWADVVEAMNEGAIRLRKHGHLRDCERLQALTAAVIEHAQMHLDSLSTDGQAAKFIAVDINPKHALPIDAGLNGHVASVAVLPIDPAHEALVDRLVVEAVEEAKTRVAVDIDKALKALADSALPYQCHEVATKFLCEARSLANAGKDELARRKLAAARNVLNGGGER